VSLLMDGSPPKAARFALFIQRVCELRHRSEPCDTMSRPKVPLSELHPVQFFPQLRPGHSGYTAHVRV
jgi:hypothetical protein